MHVRESGQPEISAGNGRSALNDSDHTIHRPGDFTGEWDSATMRRMVALASPVCKRWFRSEVRGLETFPSGGVLIVSNHSGLPFAWDAPVLWVDFFEKFGYERRLYTLGATTSCSEDRPRNR